VNPPLGDRGDLGGCRYLDDLEEVVELVHRSSTVVTTLNLVSKILCVWGGLECGA
jgi:hypothetical protein